jgi:hypothetical protein
MYYQIWWGYRDPNFYTVPPRILSKAALYVHISTLLPILSLLIFCRCNTNCIGIARHRAARRVPSTLYVHTDLQIQQARALWSYAISHCYKTHQSCRSLKRHCSFCSRTMPQKQLSSVRAYNLQTF